MHNIEYYDDSWDSSCFFVCIDKYYIFAADRKSKSPKWEFIDPRGIRWDAVHQRIYRNGRADKISKEELPANFPPPPDAIPPEAIQLPPLPTYRAHMSWAISDLPLVDTMMPMLLLTQEH